MAHYERGSNQTVKEQHSDEGLLLLLRKKEMHNTNMIIEKEEKMNERSTAAVCAWNYACATAIWTDAQRVDET